MVKSVLVNLLLIKTTLVYFTTIKHTNLLRPYKSRSLKCAITVKCFIIIQPQYLCKEAVVVYNSIPIISTRLLLIKSLGSKISLKPTKYKGLIGTNNSL